MSVRAVLAVVLALGASGAASLPFVVDGPILTVDVPLLAPIYGGDGHAHHADASHAAAAGAAGATHGHATDASGQGADATGADGSHADHSAGDASRPAAGAGPHDHAGGLGDQPGMQRPAFPPATGSIPKSPDGLKRMGSLRITDDSGVAELASGGSGTLSDPYVLRGLHFTGELDIRDTDACVLITENWFAGQLALNWNGQCMWVHHNHIRDLRVNENILRRGYGTGGLIEQNEITIIGQLRHYDGEFRGNVVGPGLQDDLFDTVLETVPYFFVVDNRVANVDGFNQGLIHHNTFYGTVDLDYHGHHHGTGFFAPHSHYHGDSSTRQAEHMHDHADRWTSVAFTDNTIVDPEGYGLRYEDQAHSGDDRRANSEDMDVLNEPHVHHTDIVLARNKVTGGQIWVDVFNADDRNHKERNPGTLTIQGNTVEVHEREERDPDLCFLVFGDLYDSRAGIHVNFAKEVTTRILDNTLGFVPLPASSDPVQLLYGAMEDCPLFDPVEHRPMAVRLDQVRDADILVQGNKATGFAVGVGAAWMDGKTQWRVVGNDFGKAQAVEYDDTVENQPTTS